MNRVVCVDECHFINSHFLKHPPSSPYFNSVSQVWGDVKEENGLSYQAEGFMLIKLILSMFLCVLFSNNNKKLKKMNE